MTLDQFLTIWLEKEKLGCGTSKMDEADAVAAGYLKPCEKTAYELAKEQAAMNQQTEQKLSKRERRRKAAEVANV